MPKLVKHNNHYLIDNPSLSNVLMQELDYGVVLDVNIEIVDKRYRSEAQKNLIFALCKDIENYSGHNSELIRYTAMKTRGVDSLGKYKCSMTQANKVIDELIDYCLMNEIPFTMKTRNSEAFQFSEKHMYMLVLTRRCCTTGKKADIHHVDKVGIGRNRNKISHIGMRVLPLCREMHNEVHAIGEEKFANKYHLTPIKVDERIEKFIKSGDIIVYEEDMKEMEQ